MTPAPRIRWSTQNSHAHTLKHAQTHRHRTVGGLVGVPRPAFFAAPAPLTTAVFKQRRGAASDEEREHVKLLKGRAGTQAQRPRGGRDKLGPASHRSGQSKCAASGPVCARACFPPRSHRESAPPEPSCMLKGRLASPLLDTPPHTHTHSHHPQTDTINTHKER